MASPATDNIRVAIRVRPLIKRENDFHSQTHWRVDRNTITQVNNGKLLSNSSYSFDRIFDVSNTTQDVYDEFGQPTVLSAMDGFNGTLFAYGQTSSGKTYTMMGDQRNEGVIPKAVGEIYDYIEKHPSREFLIRVSYMEIYNEDIKDLLNPAKTNLKIHENPQRQVYVGDLTEEVVSCGEDVFKHMLRGEKNRHFGETNMNDRSSRSHTIFRVVIESREMMDESKDPDTIDGAVRVAHLNLVDLAGSERASQTGAFGQRLKEGGHINKSLLALGSVIAKLSEGESFVPFRDSKLTRILQSSLGGNAKTSMVCTITPAAVEETISTLKFASRAKTIKNCPEVNEVLDDGTLLKRYRKEICELKKQLVEISQQSTISQMQELQIEKEKMVEMLEQQRIQQSEQEEKIKRLRNMICTAGREDDTKSSKAKLAKRRLTWCPGAALSKAPLASAAAVQARLQRISSSPSSEESEFDEIAKDAFFSSLNREEERRSNEFSRRRVGFVSPQATRCLSPVLDTELEDKDIQTEPDERIIELQKEVKKLRRNLDEAERTRDLYNELLVESNELLEKMSTEKGLSPSSMNSDVTLRYVAEMRNEKADLEAQLEVLKTQNQDLEPLHARNKELEDQVQSLENERTLSNEYLSELQAEYDSAQAEKEALAARVEGLENTGVFNQAAKMELDSLQMKLEESMKEKEQLQGNLEFWKEKYSTLESEVAGLQNELARTAAKENTEALISCNKTEIDSLHMVLEESIKEKQQLQENLASWKEKFSILEEELTNLQNQLAQVASEKVQLEEKMACVMTKASGNTKELENEMKELRQRLSSAHEQERMLSDVIEQKLQLEETIETLKADMEQNKDTSNDKGSIETRYEQLGVEKEIEIKKIMEDLNQLQQQLKEKLDEVEEKDALVAQVIEQKRKVQETFDMFKVDTENERAELKQQVEQLRAELKEKMGFIQEKAAMLSEIEQQKCEADSNLLEVRASKEKEIASLNEEMEQIRAEIQEKLCGLEEKESMLTEVIQQKCELEEKFEIFKGEKENQVRQLIQQMEELRSELQNRENGTDRKANVAEEITQEKYVVEEQLQIFREEKENQIAKLMEDIGLLQSEMEEKALILQEKEKLLSETFQQKSELESFKMEKESEIQKLNDRVKELEVQLREKTSTAEEKENCLNEMIQLKSDAEEELKTYRLEKESELEKLQRQLEESDLEKDNVHQSLDSEEKQSDRNIQLEKTINEKKELEQMLERVKKERDEIKNDLSETITDTAELQKDVFEMQQKVKRYKEHIYELESELEERGTTIATYKEKIDDLQQQLNQRIDQLATGDQETTSKDHSEREDFASLPAQEKQRAQEITEECSGLKSAVKQLENAKHDLENETQKLHQEADELREKIYDLDERLVESENARKFSEQRLQGEQEKYDKFVKDYNSNGCRACKDLEALLAESRQVSVAAEKQLEGERAKFRELTKEIEGYKSNDLRPGDKDNTVSQAELQKVKTETEELVKELTEERKAHESLRKEHSTQTEELQHLRDSLLRDTNRGMDQQRVIDKMKAERRETICVQAQQRQELEKDLHEAEKKVSELESQCSLLKSEKDVLEHRLEVANKKVEETKQEMRDLENLYNTHNTLSVTQLDDNKAVQKLKQMEFSLDLTKQKCEKAESRVKELETENRQMRGADIRNGALLEERNNLKQQVQQAKQALNEKSKKLNEFSIEVTQLRAHVDKLSEENKKNRSSLEKKENKIDSLEQKLWEMEEDLKMERQRCQEQQSQSVSVDELNSTIRVKHEELEHMTFLVDEKDIEIAEVRSSLEENETKRTEMAEKMQELEQRLNELDNDLENANKNLQEAKAGREEADARVEELKAIIKQQEVEIISMTEKLESGKANNEIQTQERDSKTQKLESDLQDTEHKLLEVESELEFTKTSWEKAKSEKDELIKILRAYSEVLNDSHRADMNEDTESLKAQLKPNLERLSALFKTTIEVEDLSNKLKETIEGSKSLEQKLSEVQTSFQEQKSALEEEVDELRESVLNEKKLVFELEDKLKFAVNDKNAMEAELRRVLEENETIVTKDDVEIKIASSESEAGLEFGKAKENVMQLENEVERLKREISTLENQVKINSIARDEEKKTWDEEMARCTERYEGEKEQLVEQLREISDLKVKESEDFCADKDEKIEELESKLLDASKTAADYERAVEHYHLKLAELEYERDTAVERLEKQSSTSNSSDNREVESLRKECELAKKKSKDAQEKYFSESDRLKAIIDEMQDEQEEFLRQMNELKEKTAKQDAEISQLRNELTETKKITHDSTNSSSYADNSEMESLKKECELAKKKCKDAQEKYFSESDRLKAIIDDMQDEQDDLIRQINDFEVKTSKKDAEISQLQNELSEMKEIAQAVKAQNKACLKDKSNVEHIERECVNAKKLAKEIQEKYSSESGKLKAIIREQQEIIDKSQMKQDTEDEMEATRIDLAQKNMQIQSLQYDLYKLQEKYDKETRTLSKEVEWGRERVGSLKLEIRRLKEPEEEDTISMIRGQVVPAQKNEASNVGVVSNVAIYSLKAKVGKLESETERLKEKVQQLEKEKATLRLLNTESSNKIAQLTSENKALKTQKKKLMEGVPRAKVSEVDSELKGDSGRRLPEVPTETLERESKNSSILGLSTVENVILPVPTAERKRIKPEAKKENFQNWLSADAADNMFKEEPNQCANQ